jgi:hypothetical protein
MQSQGWESNDERSVGGPIRENGTRKRKKPKKDAYPWWNYFDQREDGSKKCKGCDDGLFASSTTSGLYLLIKTNNT